LAAKMHTMGGAGARGRAATRSPGKYSPR
jgi:hypothetical protein